MGKLGTVFGTCKHGVGAASSNNCVGEKITGMGKNEEALGGKHLRVEDVGPNR